MSSGTNNIQSNHKVTVIHQQGNFKPVVQQQNSNFSLILNCSNLSPQSSGLQGQHCFIYEVESRNKKNKTPKKQNDNSPLSLKKAINDIHEHMQQSWQREGKDITKKTRRKILDLEANI